MIDANNVLGRCRINDLGDGEIRRCTGEGGKSFAVYRSGGQFFVTQDACTHGKASLSEGWLESYEVSCPVHEGRFDIRTGKATCFPASEPLKTYRTEYADNGDLLIQEEISKK